MNVSSSASIGNRSERSRKGGAWGFGLSPARPTAWQPEQFSVTSALPRAILSSALAVSPMLTANAIARPNSIGGILESVFNLCVMDKAGQLQVVNSQIWSKWCEAICFGYAERRRRKPFGFQVLRDKVAERMAHIVPTPKRLQAASSNRSAGGKTPTFAPLSHLLAVSGAISIIFMSWRPRRATMATGHEKAQPYWDAGGRSLTQINAPSALPSRTAEPAVGDVRANFRFALRRADSGAAMPEQWETSGGLLTPAIRRCAGHRAEV